MMYIPFINLNLPVASESLSVIAISVQLNMCIFTSNGVNQDYK